MHDDMSGLDLNQEVFGATTYRSNLLPGQVVRQLDWPAQVGIVDRERIYAAAGEPRLDAAASCLDLR